MRGKIAMVGVVLALLGVQLFADEYFPATSKFEKVKLTLPCEVVCVTGTPEEVATIANIIMRKNSKYSSFHIIQVDNGVANFTEKIRKFFIIFSQRG